MALVVAIETSRYMNPIFDYSSGKPAIKRAESICFCLNNSLPDPQKKITKIFKEIDDVVRSKESGINSGALNNCHGDWFEWLIAITAWNYFLNNENANLLLPLPKANQFEVSRLYNEKIYGHVEQLKQKLKDHTEAELISSNPDFVIIKRSLATKIIGDKKEITALNLESINRIQDLYMSFSEECDFEDIVGYLSVKTSLRPDRRLQICHEGSLIKSVYDHICHREWIFNPKRIKYFAASTKLADADVRAFNTVATHSLSDLRGLPQKAVDFAYSVNSLEEIEEMVRTFH